MGVLQYLVDLGAPVMMPIIFTVFALCLRVKFGNAIRAGLLVGIGFIGLNTIITLLTDNLGPAAQAMVQNFGLNLNVLDVGWPAASAIAFGSAVGVLIIPLCILAKIKNRGKIPRFFKIIFIIAYNNIFKGLPPKNNIKQSY